MVAPRSLPAALLRRGARVPPFHVDTPLSPGDHARRALSFHPPRSMLLASTTLLLAGIAAPTGAPVSTAAPASVAQDELPPLEMDALSYSDAISRAERLEKMVVIFWSRQDDPRSANLRSAVLDDAAVRRWIAKHAVAAEVDVDRNENEARQNRVGPLQTPSIDIYSVTRGGRIDRLMLGSDAVDFLATVMGQTDGDVATRPEGENANEPFLWLAWANQCFRTQGLEVGEEAVRAYKWCLNSADAVRPGFRARYFEFLVRRLLECKARSLDALPTLERELERLAKLLLAGKADRRDAYECSLLVTWLDTSTRGRTLMAELAQKGDSRSQERRWLISATAAQLGEQREYGPLVSAVGEDAVAIFLARAEELRGAAVLAARDPGSTAAPPAEAKEAPSLPEGVARFVSPPLPYAAPDTRADLLGDASWVFEALLHEGHAEDARVLQAELATLYPTAPRAYALFMERAMRLEMYDLAVEIGDAGVSSLDEIGRAHV